MIILVLLLMYRNTFCIVCWCTLDWSNN